MKYSATRKQGLGKSGQRWSLEIRVGVHAEGLASWVFKWPGRTFIVNRNLWSQLDGTDGRRERLGNGKDAESLVQRFGGLKQD